MTSKVDNAKKQRPCGEVHGYGRVCEQCRAIAAENKKLASRASISKDMREWILQRDNFICQYCKGEADIADHVIPSSKGGKGNPDNLVAACWSCNSRKRNRTIDELINTNPEMYGHLLK
jgi:5-methylcytosine-specific restriction endonuclease McrA